MPLKNVPIGIQSSKVTTSKVAFTLRNTTVTWAAGGIDSSGNIYTTCASDITKLNKYNKSVFSVDFYPYTDFYILDSTVDASGNIYLAGEFYNGGNPNAAIIKLNSSGVLQWQKYSTETTYQAYNKIFVDGSGNSYATALGATWPSFVKYNSSGVMQFQKAINIISLGKICLPEILFFYFYVFIK